MSLKNSERHNWSWRINTIIKSSLASSSTSSDQWYQYTKWSWRYSFILEKSIAPSFSRNRLPWMKMNQLHRHLIHGNWMFSKFTIGPSSFTNRKSSCERLADSRLYGFALDFDRLAKSLAFNLVHVLRTAFLRFPAQCRHPPCCSSFRNHEEFWPMSENRLWIQK